MIRFRRIKNRMENHETNTENQEPVAESQGENEESKKKAPCEECEGTGLKTPDILCPVCEGTGGA